MKGWKRMDLVAGRFTSDREFYSLSRICCCLLFAYSEHSLLFKSDYLLRSLWDILEPLSLLMSILDTLAGKKCGRQVLWLILLWASTMGWEGLKCECILLAHPPHQIPPVTQPLSSRFICCLPVFTGHFQLLGLLWRASEDHLPS